MDRNENSDKRPCGLGIASRRAPLAYAHDKKPITEGIIMITSAIPKEGINVVYEYHDLNSGTGGTVYANLTAADDGAMQWMGLSADVDNGFYPGDKVTLSVSKYVPNGVNSVGIPQPVLDSKTITLGETGGIIELWIDRSKFVDHPCIATNSCDD